jgi:DNA-binding GntR family transcriptional regulator
VDFNRGQLYRDARTDLDLAAAVDQRRTRQCLLGHLRVSGIDEHQELLDALADTDVERARAIAERHVLDAGRSLPDWLQQRHTA